MLSRLIIQPPRTQKSHCFFWLCHSSPLTFRSPTSPFLAYLHHIRFNRAPCRTLRHLPLTPLPSLTRVATNLFLRMIELEDQPNLSLMNLGRKVTSTPMTSNLVSLSNKAHPKLGRCSSRRWVDEGPINFLSSRMLTTFSYSLSLRSTLSSSCSCLVRL
jgi:hypothetical protein